MAKILITGGAGFIGSHLSEKLLEEGNEVFVLDNLSTGSLDNIKHLRDNSHFHCENCGEEFSVLDEALVDQMMQDVDRVYHLAAAVGVKEILDKPLKSLLTNIKGAEIVLDKAAKYNVKTLMVSTSEVSGKGEMPQGGYREDGDRTYGSVYNDRWVYAFSKAVDEFLALAYWREKKLPVSVVRLFNVIGPRQSGAYGMVVPTFIKQALSGDAITIYGTGEQSRCFGDVADIAPALVKIMECKKAEGQVVNLGSDREITISALADKVREIVEKETSIKSPEPIYIPYDKAYPAGYEDFEKRKPNLEKAKELIDFTPKVKLEESIKKIIEFQKTL